MNILMFSVIVIYNLDDPEIINSARRCFYRGSDIQLHYKQSTTHLVAVSWLDELLFSSTHIYQHTRVVRMSSLY